MKLNPISRLAAHRAGEITLDDQELKHSLVWDKLFKNGDFFDAHIEAYPNSKEGPESGENTNVMLVGPRLKEIYEGHDLKHEDEPIELALISLDWEGDSTFDDRVSGAEGLRNCLRIQDYDEANCVAIIQDYNWKLNIWQWAKSDDCTAVTDVMKFLRNGQSTYLMMAEDSGNEESLGWSVRELTSPKPLPHRPTGFRIPCTTYFYMGETVDWAFYERDGKRSVDGRRYIP